MIRSIYILSLDTLHNLHTYQCDLCNDKFIKLRC